MKVFEASYAPSYTEAVTQTVLFAAKNLKLAAAKASRNHAQLVLVSVIYRQDIQ